MTRDEIVRMAMKQLTDAAKDRDFAMGMMAVAAGTFDESTCGAAGFFEESDFCAGGREALQRLEEAEPVGRVAHGTVIGG